MLASQLLLLSFLFLMLLLLLVCVRVCELLCAAHTSRPRAPPRLAVTLAAMRRRVLHHRQAATAATAAALSLQMAKTHKAQLATATTTTASTEWESGMCCMLHVACGEALLKSEQRKFVCLLSEQIVE